MAQPVSKELQKFSLEVQVADKLVDMPWRPIFGISAAKGRHINLDEGKALRFALKREALQRKRRRLRKVIFVDSAVIVGAASKGRSASRSLNKELKGMLPWILGGRLYPQFVWIPSGANPSDPLSRGRKLGTWLRDVRLKKKKWAGLSGGWLRDLTAQN